VNEIIDKKTIGLFHSGTVLKYYNVFLNNKENIINLIDKNKDFLLEVLNKDFVDNIENIIENSMWYENTVKIILILQLLFYKKYNK
jgi:hypothetical protein